MAVLTSSVRLCSQPPLFKTAAYVNFYGDAAVEEMTEFGIPASIILAQAIFESNSGTSELAKRSNNHFGIKCHRGWEGDTIVKTDDTLNECFRAYQSVRESYRDHSLFLRSRPRYSALFSIPLTNYAAWCTGLKSSGYATCPTYASDLIRIIEQYSLYEFDRAEKMETKITFRGSTPKMVPSEKLAFIDLASLAESGFLRKEEINMSAQEIKNSIRIGNRNRKEKNTGKRSVIGELAMAGSKN